MGLGYHTRPGHIDIFETLVPHQVVKIKLNSHLSGLRRVPGTHTLFPSAPLFWGMLRSYLGHQESIPLVNYLEYDGANRERNNISACSTGPGTSG